MKPVGCRVAVLLATRNGEAFLDEQLQSLAGQTFPNIDLHASDDGSTDGTVARLRAWAGRWGRGSFGISRGPGQGFAENFRSLVIGTGMQADHFAFCDQDDIWEPRKLATAVEWLDAGDPGRPRLFCSRTLTVDSGGTPTGLSPLFSRPPSFRNALVQSLAGGNTMVFNRAAFELLRRASLRSGFVSHDWWAYLIVTGAGGEVNYCVDPLVRYRQHAANLVGANTSARARLDRIRRLLGGQFARWTDINLAGLSRNRDLLTPDARAVCDSFAGARGGPPTRRLRLLRASGVYRQTGWGSASLWFAIAAGRL